VNSAGSRPGRKHKRAVRSREAIPERHDTLGQDRCKLAERCLGMSASRQQRVTRPPSGSLVAMSHP